MLFNGEQVGNGVGPEVDVAVDPLEGTTLTALGMPNAISVIAVSERGHDVLPRRRALHGQDRGRPRGRGRDRHRRDANGEPRASRRGEGPRRRTTSPSSSSTATRHDDLIAELREAGARVNLIRDGDVAAGDRGRAGRDRGRLC